MWALFRIFGCTAVLPVLLTCIAFPYITIRLIELNGAANADYIISLISQCLVMIFSVWWGVMYLSNYLEEDGNEILYINHKERITEMIFLLVLYSILVFLYYVVVNIWYSVNFGEWIRTFIEINWFLSWFYFLAYLLTSMIWSLAIIVFYYFASLMVLPQSLWFVFFSSRPFDSELFICKYIIMFIISIFVWKLGLIFNKQYEGYR